MYDVDYDKGKTNIIACPAQMSKPSYKAMYAQYCRHVLLTYVLHTVTIIGLCYIHDYVMIFLWR